MAVDGAGLGSLDSSETAFFVFAVAEVALTGCVLLLMLSVCGYVVRCRRRGRRLCLPRANLGMLGIFWLLSAFFSHVAIWDILESVGVISVDTVAEEMEIVCMATTSFSLGLVEPSMLLLIAEVIRLKTAGAAGRRRLFVLGWTLSRRAYALALPFVLLQALMMCVSTIQGMTSIGFVPQPGLSIDVGMQPSSSASAGLDDGLVGSGPISEEEVYKWWHPEGCAISIGSLAVSAVFILPFEFFWTLWCLRLAKLVLNIKMRRRLLVVQLTYTFIPGAVLLLRASKIFIQANHQGVLRLMNLFEILLIILGCWVCNLHLLWRPLKEGGAAVWSISDSNPAGEPHASPKYVALSAVDKIDTSRLVPTPTTSFENNASPNVSGLAGTQRVPIGTVVVSDSPWEDQTPDGPVRLMNNSPVHLMIEQGDDSDPPPPGLSERCVCDSGSGVALGVDALACSSSPSSHSEDLEHVNDESGSHSEQKSSDGKGNSQPSPGSLGDRLRWGGKPLRSIGFEMAGRSIGLGDRSAESPRDQRPRSNGDIPERV